VFAVRRHAYQAVVSEPKYWLRAMSERAMPPIGFLFASKVEVIILGGKFGTDRMDYG